MGSLRESLRLWGWHLRPWWGAIGGGLAWVLTHLTGNMIAQDKCDLGNPRLIGLLGLAGLLIAVLGAWISLGVWRRREQETETRAFLGFVNGSLAALLAVAIVWQTLASFIIPGCMG